MSDRQRVTMLYVGVRHAEKGGVIHFWVEVDGIENDGSSLSLDKLKRHFYADKRSKNIVHASPGMIYTIEADENHVYPSSAKYVGRWDNQEDVIKWTAESNAIERAIELAARAKKEAKDRLDWKALEPFRAAYHDNLNYKQQQMLLAQIVQYVTDYQEWRKSKK